MIPLKKKWYVIQTYSGLEESIRENVEIKRDSLNLGHLIGRVVIPEEVVVDPVNAQTVRYVVTPGAKLHVGTGDEVKKATVIAEENPIRVRYHGNVVELRNYRKIMIETLDGKYVKSYFIPETYKVESGIKPGVKIRQGMPLAKEGEFICEMDGTVLVSQRVKKIVISRDEEPKNDTYYVPLDIYDSSIVKRGAYFKEGTEISDKQEYKADFDGLVEVIDQGTRKTLKLVKVKRRRLFPGYVFVEMAMTDSSWHTIFSIPNVINFVSSGGAPQPIKNSEAKVIMRLAGLEAPEKAEKKAAKVEINFEVSEVVRIKSGAFADFMGTIDEINHEKHELKVMVNIFGRETPVLVHVSEVDKM